MGRWDTGETKTQGLFGCAMMWVFIGILAMFFYKNYQNLEDRRTLEKVAYKVAANYQRSKTPQIARQSVVQDAAAKGIKVDPDDVTVDIEMVHSNPKVTIEIEMRVNITLFVTEFEMSLPVRQEVQQVF